MPEPQSHDDQVQRTVGICLSGGGVRSAAFSLGAIQALQKRLGLAGPVRSGLPSPSSGAASGGAYDDDRVMAFLQGYLKGAGS